MYTIGQLSKRFKLSRGTLLYYDTIGLLNPAGRTEGNYRLYTEADLEKLEAICRYRETGMALDDIQKVVNRGYEPVGGLLEKRLEELNREMQRLSLQRRVILCMLQNKTIPPNDLRAVFVSILEKTGFAEADLTRLHTEYEKAAPEEHQTLLEFLGFSPEEIRQIREHSRQLLEST